VTFNVTHRPVLPPPMARHSPVGHGLIIEASHTPHSVALWMSDQPDAGTCTWQHKTQETDIHTPGGIRTRSLNKQAAADPRFRPRGHLDWPEYIMLLFFPAHSQYSLCPGMSTHSHHHLTSRFETGFILPWFARLGWVAEPNHSVSTCSDNSCSTS